MPAKVKKKQAATATAPTARKVRRSKKAKLEAGAQPVQTVARVAKTIAQWSQEDLDASVALWASWDEPTRAAKLAAQDPDALMADAQLRYTAQSARVQAQQRVALLAAQASVSAEVSVARAKKVREKKKVVNSARASQSSALTCIIDVDADALKEPQDPRVPATALQHYYSGQTFPIPVPTEKYYRLLTSDNPAQLTANKRKFIAFLPHDRPTDQVKDIIIWSWREVLITELSACRKYACVRPVPVGDITSFRGNWGKRKVIGVLLRADMPLIYVMSADYDHDQRDANYELRRAILDAEEAAAL